MQKLSYFWVSLSSAFHSINNYLLRNKAKLRDEQKNSMNRISVNVLQCACVCATDFRLLGCCLDTLLSMSY